MWLWYWILLCFPLNNIHPHQVEHLSKIIEHGGIGFIIVNFKMVNEIISIKNKCSFLLSFGAFDQLSLFSSLNEDLKMEKEAGENEYSLYIGSPDPVLIKLNKDLPSIPSYFLSSANVTTSIKIVFEEDIMRATFMADVIYTDVWVSMGEENQPGIKERIESLTKYQVNKKLMEATGKDSVFFHCLPASHENGTHYMEVTEDVFESQNSLVFEEAENRMHTIKAVIAATLGNNF